ncbi:MAG TPA: hypothetical protein VJS43_11880, partial [Candidatus Acidoferrales bacterium]|nr:hypothetical protein [Candidatus Acidoferrales bacterium]
MIESAAALSLAVALVSGALLLRARKQLCSARATCTAFETVPLEWFRWRADQAVIGKSGDARSYSEFLTKLLAADAARLEKARQRLHSHGTAFSATFATRGATAYAVHGRRIASGDDILWLVDATAPLALQRARQEAADLREMLDAIP